MPLAGLTNDCLEVSRNDEKKPAHGLINNIVKVARKTMPLTTCVLPETDNLCNVDSMEEDEKRMLQKPLPNTSSYYEYLTDKSSMEQDNQLPTTPVSTWSNSLKNETSLSDTDFSQLSSFNVDLFESIENSGVNPLQFEKDKSDLLNDEALFHALDKESSFSNNDIINPLEMSKMADALNEETIFDNLENTGVCIHIKSNRVSLEYCSVCHMNSLNPSSEYH